MSTIITRAGKGSILTNTEMDSNFTNLNNDKLETNPALGTPVSGVLTNCTGLPTAGLVNDAVTYAKIQNVSATDKLLGRSTAGSGDIEEITCTSFARSILDDANEAAFKATVNLEIGIDVQAYDADIPTVAASQVEMEAGTETAIRSISPLRVSQAISALGNFGLTIGTPVTTTSGTAADWTDIPAGTKQITISFSNLAVSGTNQTLIQIGDSDGIETSGYAGSGSNMTTAVASFLFTTGFGIYSGASANLISGSVVLSLTESSTNKWTAFGILSTSNIAASFLVSGSKVLTGELDRVRITTS